MASVILNDDQRLYLQTIFDYFQKEGKWPTHKYLERFFIRTHPDLDIEELVRTLPFGLTNPVNLNDTNSTAYLSVPAVYLCKNSTQILDYFIRLIQRCVEILFNADVTEPRITSEEIVSLYAWGEKAVRQVGLLSQAEPNIWSTFGYNDSDGSWTGVIWRGIRRFREVQTIEQYLEIRGGINQASSKPPDTFTEEPQVDNPPASASQVAPQVDNFPGSASNAAPQIESVPENPSEVAPQVNDLSGNARLASQADPQVGNSPANASNAAPQVDNKQYIPRAFGGTLVGQTKQEELQVDNLSANASQVVPQVDSLPGNASNAAPQVVNHGEQTEHIEITIRALADTPSDIDLLHFSDFADALVDFIKSEKTQKPLTIAIDAAWGMGKTTLMRMIQHKLEGKADKEKQESPPTRVERKQKDQNTTTKPTFPIVWFNAWQYDQEDSLWAALVLEILDQVRKQYTLKQKMGFWWDLTQRRLGKHNRLLRVALRVLPFIISILVLAAILFAIAWFWRGNMLIAAIKRWLFPSLAFWEFLPSMPV